MVKKFDIMLLGGTLTMMVVSILLMSDSVIAGIFVGSDAVEGISLVTPIYSVSAFFGSAFSLGIPIIYSMKMGGFKKQEADRTFGVGLLMCISAGLILFILSSVFGEAFIGSFHPSERAFKQALDYLHWMRFTILLLPLDMLMAEMVYNDGDDSISVAANCVQGIGNLTASLLLSRRFGIRGIAFASFLFTLLSLAVLFTHFLRKKNTLRLSFYFSPDIIFSIVRYSAIDASTYLWLGIGNAVLNRFVCSYYGADYLILVSVITLCREFQLVFDGIGEAITPIISVYLGEDCFPGVRTIYSRAQKAAVLEGIIMFVLIQIMASFAPAMLGITDVELMRLAVNGLRIVSLGSVFISILYLSTSYYLLLERTALGIAVSALRDCLVSVPFSVFFGLLYGVYGMFGGFALSSFIAWLISTAFLHIKYGSDAPLLLGRKEMGKQSLLYSFDVEEQSIMETRDLIGNAVEDLGFDERTVNRTMLVFEELFMLIYEKNPGVKVQAECALLIDDNHIRIISRDTGTKVDIADPDMMVDTLRSYVISNVTNKISSQKYHLVTMSFNRNMIELEGKKV